MLAMMIVMNVSVAVLVALIARVSIQEYRKG